MTQIDLELKSMAKSALREYISSRGAIDWEQRRYEIAKDVLCVLGIVLGMLPVLKIDSVMILMVPSILPMHSSRNFGKEVRNEP